MKLLMIIDCYLPSEKSIAKLADDLARQFVRQEHEVTILVPSDALATRVEATREDPGIEVIRYRTGKIKGASKIRRAVGELLLSLVALMRTRRLLAGRRFDAIVFYSPSIFFGPLVAWFKYRWRARAYLILRDIFPGWAVQVGVMGKGPVYTFFRFFERLQYAVADVIGVESPRSVAHFENSPHLGKVELLRNWADPAPSTLAAAGLRGRLGLEGKIIFVYGGNFGVAQDMDNILRLARRMAAHPEAHFLLVGSGSETERMKETIAREGITNVTLLPAAPQDVYLSIISQCDVGLISLDRRLKTCNCPGKLLGYLGCGLPTLASINPGNDIGEVIETAGAGLASLNGDDDAFYLNALHLCDPALRAAMGTAAARLLREKFSPETAAGQILDRVAAAEKPGIPALSSNAYSE